MLQPHLPRHWIVPLNINFEVCINKKLVSFMFISKSTYVYLRFLHIQLTLTCILKFES